MQSISRKPIKLAVIGTRNFLDKKRIYFELDELRKLKNIVEIVSGHDINNKIVVCCDSIARDYAIERCIKYTGFPADWKDMREPCLKKKGQYGEYNALAGPNRNTKIAEYSDEAVAFWNYISTGTHDCIKKFGTEKKVKIFRITC